MKKSLFKIFSFIWSFILVFSLASCGSVENTLESLQNEYGVVIEGGDFLEGSILVSNEVLVSSEEGKVVLDLIKDQDYKKDGNVYIFDIYVIKDGERVQPKEKVKVSMPTPTIDISNYLVFHIKMDNSVESLVSTLENGMISFETSSFSYFVIAEEAIQEHVHTYTFVEEVAPTCEKEGTVKHYHCDECGKNFDMNYGEIEDLTIEKLEHNYGSMYWGKSPSFWEDGNIEYYQCDGCGKYFDKDYNEVESVILPKMSTNISICVNGVAKPLEIV